MKTLKFKFIAVAFASFMINANTASAQAISTSYSINAEEPFSVKYLGNDADYLLFEIIVNSTEAKTASLGVSDKIEGELYTENFQSSLKKQKLKIEKKDYKELSFKLRTGKNIYTKSFSVNISSIENTLVSENNITRL